MTASSSGCCLALLIEFRTWRHPTAAGAMLQGVALAMMFACRLSSAVPIASFGLWLLLRTPRRAGVVALVGVAAYAPWAWYYHTVYGNPLRPVGWPIRVFHRTLARHGGSVAGQSRSRSAGVSAVDLAGADAGAAECASPSAGCPGRSAVRLALVLHRGHRAVSGTDRLVVLLVGRPVLGIAAGRRNRALFRSALSSSCRRPSPAARGAVACCWRRSSSAHSCNCPAST